MAKKDRKNKSTSCNNVNIVLSDSLNSEEIQKIITNSLLAVEDAKAQKIAEQKEIERKELRKFMGYKEHDDKKGFKKNYLFFSIEPK